MRSPSLTSLKQTELAPQPQPVAPAFTPVPHGGPPPPLHPSETALDAVLQIEASHRVPDTVQPWRRQSPTRSVGTAFAVAPRLVVTSAMHALYATHVTLRRRGHDEPFVATVLAASHDADLAVLAVPDAAFWTGLTPLPLAPAVPPLQDRVAALAFRADADNVAVATGALSRLKMDDLSASVGARLVVAVDLRQSRDDRGAPVVDARGHVVGMLTTPRARLVAVDTLRRFLAELRDTGAFGPVPHAGFEWQPTVNRSLRRSLQVPSGQTGVYVRAVPEGPSRGALRVGDVVTALDGVAVSSKGTVRLRGREKVSLTYVTAHKRAGDMLRADILRDGRKHTVCYRLVGHDAVSLIPLRRFDSRPDYVAVGGLVFATLGEQYLLDAWGKEWPHAAPLRLRELVEDGVGGGRGETEDEIGGDTEGDTEGEGVRRIVLLTQMLTSHMTVMYEYAMPGPCRLVRFNGRPVPDLPGLVRMLHECTDEFLVFDLDEQVLVLDRAEALAASPGILAEHGAMHAARIGDVAGDIGFVAGGGSDGPGLGNGVNVGAEEDDDEDDEDFEEEEDEDEYEDEGYLEEGLYDEDEEDVLDHDHEQAYPHEELGHELEQEQELERVDAHVPPAQARLTALSAVI